MSKFCRVFENKNGSQLLLLLGQSDSNPDKAGCSMIFEADGNQVNITIGGVE